MPDIKTLPLIAATRGKQDKLLFCFNAFSDDGDIQAVSHGNDRRNQRLISCCGLICPDTSIGGKSTNGGALHGKAAQDIQHQPEVGSG